MIKKILPLIGLTLFVHTELLANTPDDTIFPTQFKVYTNDAGQALNHPFPGFVEKILPTFNGYLESPGCYIACYSHSSNLGIYPVASNIFVVGQIRIAGKYRGAICYPTGHERSDISADPEFKKLCSQKFHCENNSCWAGGETGDWFGLKPD